jgi:hypothetical protein
VFEVVLLLATITDAYEREKLSLYRSHDFLVIRVKHHAE